MLKWLVSAATLLAPTIAAAAVNLAPNGDFEAGLTGFTSDYVYSPAVNNDEAQFTVRDDPFPWNPAFASAADHSDPGTMMFVGNGAPTAGQTVWRSSPIAIASATDYFFEAFLMNVCCNASYGGANSAPILSFSVALDGGAPMVLATFTIPLSPPGVWYGLSTSFNSGAATTAMLSLVNANTERSGNDFAVDDIFLGVRSTVNPVPEPSAWALMLLGFGGVGAALRQRRRVALGARP